ncbi:L-alanine exporter AlaE [Vibrio rumoiensis]|uniref:L-alanine exporter AlaE n=1 Tax=Vibrio rumoiensis TaxID=76258 RepID=A0ABW7IWY3_9VIBR|nr:L-alanine exporter AlaE [Vibrio rumoiensis]
MSFSGSARFRQAAADMFAMVVFSFIAGMAIEIFVSGMSFHQSLASRTLSIPVNIVIAIPYGLFRDWVLRNSQRISEKRGMKKIADMFAYVTFQSPVYAMILLVVGATPSQIVTAVISNAVVAGAMGVVYGVFLDACRKWFRVPAYT